MRNGLKNRALVLQRLKASVKRSYCDTPEQAAEKLVLGTSVAKARIHSSAVSTALKALRHPKQNLPPACEGMPDTNR
jgi:hypothetical protein